LYKEIWIVVIYLNSFFESFDGFEVTIIPKGRTGLPFDIWADSVGKDRGKDVALQRVKVVKGDVAIELSFYADPVIEAGEQNIEAFGIDDVNTAIEYIKKHKVLFIAHWNHEIDDCELGTALKIHKKNYALTDVSVLRVAVSWLK
jgi:hypothetical protein